mmetsp:Transcript_11738/g.23109  ORF Transcript_11738/g.23109 Transcript_11738/m.23109 type:complete len:96 (-) Transcript_11738:705-992(-)
MGAIFNELVQVFNEPVDVRSSAIALRIVTLNTNTIIAITSLIFPDVSPSKSHTHTHADRQTDSSFSSRKSRVFAHLLPHQSRSWPSPRRGSLPAL